MTTTDDLRRARNVRVAAQRRKRIALAQLRGEPTAPIDAAPVRNTTRRLIELGWSAPAILTLANCEASTTGLLLIANGHSRKAERKFEAVANLPITAHVPDHIPDEMLVPSLGAARRIQALMFLGWRHADISEIIARTSHHLSRQAFRSINAHDWRLVDAAYDKLSATPGPSNKSRLRAEKHGYVPPFAWLDIDDPAERPSGRPIAGWRGPHEVDPAAVERLLSGERIRSTRAEKEEAMRRWTATGRPAAELCRMHGWRESRYWKKPAA